MGGGEDSSVSFFFFLMAFSPGRRRCIHSRTEVFFPLNSPPFLFLCEVPHGPFLSLNFSFFCPRPPSPTPSGHVDRFFLTRLFSSLLDTFFALCFFSCHVSAPFRMFNSSVLFQRPFDECFLVYLVALPQVTSHLFFLERNHISLFLSSGCG